MTTFNRVNHVGIVVDSLDDAKRFLGEALLGLELVRELDVAALQRRVAFFQCGEIQLEFIEPYGQGAKERELGGERAKIEHIAVEVDDVRSALETLAETGLRADRRGVVQVGDKETVWTEPESSDGVMYQLVPKGW
jgi:methylmalonyl-CoA/ethylmalonyl-CoA epimerase